VTNAYIVMKALAKEGFHVNDLPGEGSHNLVCYAADAIRRRCPSISGIPSRLTPSGGDDGAEFFTAVDIRAALATDGRDQPVLGPPYARPATKAAPLRCRFAPSLPSVAPDSTHYTARSNTISQHPPDFRTLVPAVIDFAVNEPRL
jgi:hypothetical protein